MLALLLLSVLLAPARAAGWVTDLPSAIAQSKRSQKPVLLDFQAPWCYSCYYMEQRVLSKPGFSRAAEALVPVKLDVDTPEGAALKAKHRVTFLPTYVLMGAGGERELGRIVGEQTEADFLEKLAALGGGGKTRDEEALALHAKIKTGDLAALREALKGSPDCQTPYAVIYGEGYVAKLPAPARAALLGQERAALETLADQRLFTSADRRCADFRSGVEALASVDQAVGDAAARGALLDRAIAQLEKDQPAVGEDRNRDDNLRLFLDMRGDEAKLRAHYEALIKAYPADYVYAFRWAKHLSGRGQPAQALPWIEKADKLCYGANRLTVTNVRAKILAALGRKPEAVALLRRDLQASGGRFESEAGELGKTLAELSSPRPTVGP